VDLHAGSIGFLRVALNSAKILGYRNDQVYPEGESGARSGMALEKEDRCPNGVENCCANSTARSCMNLRSVVLQIFVRFVPVFS
jgi:hypothetical protein